MDKEFEDPQRQLVYSAWRKSGERLVGMMGEHADRQEQYTQSIDDYLKFQLSTAGVVLTFFATLGKDPLRDSPYLQFSLLSFALFFLLVAPYYFVVLHRRKVRIYDAFARTANEYEQEMSLELDYLIGRNGVIFEAVKEQWGKLTEQAIGRQGGRSSRMKVDPFLYFVQVPYFWGVTLIVAAIMNFEVIRQVMGAWLQSPLT